MENLKDRVIVITGAGSGIGEGIAMAAAKADMKVVVADINLENAQKVTDIIVANGGESAAFAVDVSDAASVQRLADAVIATYGQVDVLCNNAGVWVGALMQNADIKDWQWLINVNLYGVINGVTAFLPVMLKQGFGHIVNTSSMGGLIAGPPEGLYCTTKFAIVGLSEALLMEVADKGIGVSLLCPGLVKTRLIDSGESRPEEFVADITHNEIGPDVEQGLDPMDIGQRVIDAVEDNEFYVITHNDYRDFIKMRHDSIIDAIDKHAERYNKTKNL